MQGDIQSWNISEHWETMFENGDKSGWLEWG
jgi:hypothetical protein